MFAVKGPRFVTHMKKLSRGRGTAGQLLRLRRARARRQARPGALAAAAEPRLRPGAAGRVLRAAAAHHRRRRRAGRPARRADGGPGAADRADADRPLRHALEVRHDSFETAGFVELLRAHDVALVVADTAGRVAGAARRHLRLRVRPAARRRGALRQRLRSAGAGPLGGPHPHLGRRRHTHRRDRARAAGPATPRDVVVYFDNDVKVRAPFDAIELADRLGVSPLARSDLPVGRHRDVDEQARTDWPEIARTGRGPRAAARARRQSTDDPAR